MGFCFSVFFCKPVDVVEGISLRACCSDGVCKIGVVVYQLSVRFNLVVGSLLSPLDLCKHQQRN